jgi:hypothetical protein
MEHPIVTSSSSVSDISREKRQLWCHAAQSIIFYGGVVFGQCFDQLLAGEVPSNLDAVMDWEKIRTQPNFVRDLCDQRFQVQIEDDYCIVRTTNSSVTMQFHPRLTGSGYSCGATFYDPVEAEVAKEDTVIYIKDGDNPYFIIDKY